MRTALLLSLVVHLLVMFGALRVVRFNRVKFVPRQVYEVSLLDPAPVKAAPPKPVQQPPVIQPEVQQPEPKPEPEPDLEPPPAPPKKKTPPKKKSEPKKTLPKADLAKTTPQPVEQPAEPAAAAETGDLALDSEDFPFAFYIRNMKAKIAGNWRVPGGAKVEQVCWVRFKVDRSGRITDVGVESSSGNLLYDQAAQRAVLQSSPLPPLPSGFEEDHLGVTFAFSYVAE